MKSAANQQALVSFFERLRYAESRLLMLDYDGTLAPFTTDRKRAVPYPGVPELISEIMQSRTRVALISGRAAAEVLLLCGISPHPEIWGSHGTERIYSDGSYHIERCAEAQREALDTMARELRKAGLHAKLEIKPVAIAVHWRGLSEADRSVVESEARAIYSSTTNAGGLTLVPFDGGLEIRSTAKNKGDVVGTLVGEYGDKVAAAYLGDDLTDEDAFRVIKGHGLAVLVRGEPRATEADIHLTPPDELIQFFQDWLVASAE